MVAVGGWARVRGRTAPALGPHSSASPTLPKFGFFMKVFRNQLWQVTVSADSVLEDLRCPGLAASDTFQRWLMTPVRLYISEKVTSFENSFSLESRSYGACPGSTRGAVPALLLPAESLPAGSLGETPALPKANRENVLKKKLSKHSRICTGCLLKCCTALMHIFLFSCHIYNLSSSPHCLLAVCLAVHCGQIAAKLSVFPVLACRQATTLVAGRANAQHTLEIFLCPPLASCACPLWP